VTTITTTSLTLLQQATLAALPAHDDARPVRVAELLPVLQQSRAERLDTNAVARLLCGLAQLGLAVRRRNLPDMPDRFPRWSRAAGQ
jgi:hypothetical protein